MNICNGEPIDDESLLDSIFESALFRAENGLPVEVEGLTNEHAHLQSRIERTVRLAHEIAASKHRIVPTVPGYSVLHEIGHGGMGTVYLARQHAVGDRLVALKILPQGPSLSARARQRFLTEATAIGALHHPHIVSVYDIVIERGLFAYAMEWIDGRTLAEVLEFLKTRCHASAQPLKAGERRAVVREGEQTTNAVFEFLTEDGIAAEKPTALGSYTTFVCRMAIAIARALRVVHRANLLHRDVKPSNILLRRDGTPLLSDFGLVRETDTSIVTQSGHFVGTAAYASPEQLRGEHDKVDNRSDVYSLGVTAYHALTLRLPFTGKTPTELLDQIEREKCAPIRRINPALPRDLETIVSKAMAPEPARRYQSADELADDLERLLSLQPIKAKPATLTTRVYKAARRNRASLLGAVVGSVIALAVVASAAMYFFVLPRWARQSTTQARLLLLDPEYANYLFISEFFGLPVGASEPHVERLTGMQLAIDHYRTAEWCQPFDPDIRQERQVVETALAACHIDSPNVRKVASSYDAPDSRSAGLFALLTNNTTVAIDAWTQFDLQQEPDPFVEAALGQLYIARGEYARAYPRLRRAVDAFPNVSFLTQYLADAALHCGDVEKAQQWLNLARSQPLQDRQRGFDRIQAEIFAAQDRVDEAIALFEWSAQNSRLSQFSYARYLESRGHQEEALAQYAKLVYLVPNGQRTRDAFANAMKQWWETLPWRERTDVVRRSLDDEPLSNRPLVAWLKIYEKTSPRFFPTLSCPIPSTYLQRDVVSLETLAGRMEVEDVERWYHLRKMPSIMKDWLVESWLSPRPTLQGRIVVCCAEVLATIDALSASVGRFIATSPRPVRSATLPRRSPAYRSITLPALVALAPVTGISIANPIVPGFTVETFATVTAPMRITFDSTGMMYVGNNVESGSIYRIDQSGMVSMFGASPMEDPDAVAFDAAGTVSGVPESVLVGGWSGAGTSGIIYAIWPDESVHVLFGPTPSFENPGEMIVDDSGRLVFTDGNLVGVATGGRLMIAGGGAPVSTFTSVPGMAGVAITETGEIFTVDADGLIRMHEFDGSVINPSYANIASPTSLMDKGPGTGSWGNDLYLVKYATSELLRINSSGVAAVIGTGLPTNVTGLHFGPDGALYISDYDNNRILRIRCGPPTGFTGLGDLPGGTVFSATAAISADGTTVVGESSSALSVDGGFFENEPFRWRMDIGMQALGDLPGNEFGGEANGISADGGVIVGRSRSANSAAGDDTEGFMWTEGGGMVALGDRPNGLFKSAGTGISDDATIVGGWSSGAEDVRLSYWTSESGWISADPSPSVLSRGFGMSRNGQWIVGAAGAYEACRWSQTTGFELLGELPGGSTYSSAEAVADNGTVVGGSGSVSGIEAFRWTETGNMLGLGDLTGGSFDSFARGITADGMVIVGHGTSANGAEAVLWDESLSIHRLADVLANNGVAIPCGWTLRNASDITENCGVITLVGNATNPNGNTEAWVASYIPGSSPVVPYACDDGDACTIDDSCEFGPCAGTPVNAATYCTDNNPCTTDSCDAGIGCINTDNTNPCTDDNACTVGDGCAAGACVPGAPLDCDDDNECTNDGCNPGTGCTNVNNSEPCDDDNSCTSNDVCSGGACAGTPPRPWGDITPADCDPVVSGCNVVNIDDILCVLSSFAGNYTCAGGLANADIVPCAGNGVINLDDILGVLNAFTGANACPCVP